MRYLGNDRITALHEKLYIGGIENNVRRTLPLVEMWVHFGHPCKKWDTYHNNYQHTHIIHHFPFDDGDLRHGQHQWLKAFEIIKAHPNKKVLVSCTEGVSRSAVIALWLLCEERMDFESALRHLKQQRRIHIDRNFEPFVHYLADTYRPTD